MDGAATIITAVDKIIKRLEASKARLRVLRAKLASDMAALYLGEITSQEVEGIRQEIREIKSFLADAPLAIEGLNHREELARKVEGAARKEERKAQAVKGRIEMIEAQET